MMLLFPAMARSGGGSEGPTSLSVYLDGKQIPKHLCARRSAKKALG